MDNTILISIIIISYNIKNYIKEALDSCFNQDYLNIEIICIDDGSTDGTFEVIEETIKQNNKIKNIKIIKKENGGPNSAREEGVRVANGDYIFFMDGDDILPPNAISSLSKELNNHLYDIVFGSFKIIVSKEDNNKIFNYDLIKGTSGIKALETYIYKPKAIWGKLIKTSLFATNNLDYLSNFKIGEDAALMTQLLYYSKTISESKNIVYKYRARRINSLYTQYGHNNNYEYIIPSYLYISNFLKAKNLINNPIFYNYFHNIIYEYLTAPKYKRTIDKDIQNIINNIPNNIIPNYDKIAKIIYPISKIDIKIGRLFLILIQKWFNIKGKLLN